MTRLRAVWPNVRIRVRGDGGFGNPTMYAVCERVEITYTFGLSTNAVIVLFGLFVAGTMILVMWRHRVNLAAGDLLHLVAVERAEPGSGH